MVRGEVEGQPKLSVAEADRIVHERLDQCHVTRSPMWMPGVILWMVSWTHARELKARMTIGLPGADRGHAGLPALPDVGIPVHAVRAQVMLEACNELQAHAEGRTEGQVQLILPEEPKYAKSIERFYVKYSHLLRSVYSIEPGERALS